MKTKLLLISLLICSLVAADYTSEALREEKGIRALGMGGAYTAVADDTSALYYNPAGLATPLFQFSTAYYDTRSNYHKLGTTTAFKMGHFAYAKDRFVGPDSEVTEVHNYGFGLRGAGAVNYGLNFKKIIQENPVVAGNGWAADFGLLCNITDDLRFGFNVQNFSQGNLETRPSYRLGLAKYWNDFVFVYDSELFDRFDRPNGSQTQYGVEWNISEGFALRTGLLDTANTYGFSMNIFGLKFEYANMHSDRDVVYRYGVKLGDENDLKYRKTSLYKEKEFLLLDLRKGLIPGQTEVSIFGGVNLGTDYIVHKIKLAAEDKDIAGIVLRLRDFGNNLSVVGMIQEIREELKRFKAKGKKVIVYIDGEVSSDTYYLASIGDKIIIPKGGAVIAVGKSLTVTRFYGLFKKLGINFEVLKVGEHKDSLSTYREAYTLKQREHLKQLVNDLNDYVISEISEIREIDEKDLIEIKEGGIISATRARKFNLVDELGYYEDALEYMKKEADLAYEPKIIEPDDLISYEPDSVLLPDYNTIALVDIDGVIIDGRSEQNFLFGGKTVGSETIVKELKKIGEQDHIRAVIIRINSPGGSAIASDEIYRNIMKLREDGKYIVASMGNLAASGGYYIAAAADEVVANPGSLTGSIGVIGMILKGSKLYEMLDIKEENIKTGEHLDMFDFGRDLTEKERRMIYNYQLEIYEQFKLAVAEGRGILYEDIEPMAQGKIFTGLQAQELGLVDQIGTISDAIRIAKNGANIVGKAKIIRVIKVDKGWLMLRSRVSAMLGLDKINFLNESNQGLAQFNTYMY